MLLNWIIRFFRGERLRKATPGEHRYYSAYFLMLPVGAAVLMSFKKPLFDQANPITIWVVMIIFGVSLASTTFLWGRFVPARISWKIGGILWLAALILALSGRL